MIKLKTNVMKYKDPSDGNMKDVDALVINGNNAEGGSDGFSPIAKVEQTEDGAVISITDKNGTTTATVKDGKDGIDGKDGQDGADGYTPQKGVDYFDGKDGKDGINGSDGKDGQDGKSAYQYALDGGYEGTEVEFADKLASDINVTEEEKDQWNGYQAQIDEIQQTMAHKDEIPTKTSDLENDSGHITNMTQGLVYYYKKTETYTKDEVNQKMPTKTSQLTNDSGYITEDDLPNIEIPDVDLSEYATKEYVDNYSVVLSHDGNGNATIEGLVVLLDGNEVEY